MDKQQVWDAIATPNNWDPNDGDKKIFFSKRLQIEVAQLYDLSGVNMVPDLITITLPLETYHGQEESHHELERRLRTRQPWPQRALQHNR